MQQSNAVPLVRISSVLDDDDDGTIFITKSGSGGGGGTVGRWGDKLTRDLVIYRMERRTIVTAQRFTILS